MKFASDWGTGPLPRSAYEALQVVYKTATTKSFEIETN